ncbi:MAG: hypothetical protein QGF59_09000 [Pirellulaceae bacterium]|nr:hypothetical protein [Planctomycetaceae bacterium]MDP6718772.1 hypothetical protein [Pirellulaceae bacterium]
MSTMTCNQRTYDQRLRELVQTTRDIQLATQHGVPASTARGWTTTRPTKLRFYLQNAKLFSFEPTTRHNHYLQSYD